MPKAAPSQVIIHRIELQETERRILEQFVNAYTFEQVSNPVVEILKDVSALYAVVTMIELFTDIDLPITTPADGAEIWDAVKDAWNTRREAYPDEPGAGSLAMLVKDTLMRFFFGGGGGGGGGGF